MQMLQQPQPKAEEEEVAAQEEDDDDFLREYMRRRMEEMMAQISARLAPASVMIVTRLLDISAWWTCFDVTRPNFGQLVRLEDGQAFLDAVDKEKSGVTVIVHIYAQIYCQLLQRRCYKRKNASKRRISKTRGCQLKASPAVKP
ncbi:hypothetical protein V5799_012516 [Amblyomma americanum]|uniref:Phosducin domain-containing protein n=1 Tax=Amblyomma americanum TaxID=6943 RepID=A0AAQ4EE67_AMBAM